MTEKSHVGLETAMCPVCGKTFETGAILLDKRLKATLERTNLTHYELCPEHKELWEKGFVALVVIDPEKSKPDDQGSIKLENAYRTGVIVHLKAEAFTKVFGSDPLPMVFIDPDIAKRLEQIKAEVEKEGTD